LSEDHLERTVLGRVGVDRRSFIKKLVVGTAFAMPVVASFEMLASSSVAAGTVTCTAGNGGAGTSATGTAGGAGGSRRAQSPGACGGTPDGATGGASGGGVASDRNLKTAVTPVVWF
jgi:hypothetical protein